MAEVVRLSALLSQAQVNEGSLRGQNQFLHDDNARLKEELELLRNVMDRNTFDHKIQIAEVAKTSRRSGQASIVEEIGRVWTSHEFAAELMYGLCLDCCNEKVTNSRQVDVVKHIRSMTAFGG